MTLKFGFSVGFIIEEDAIQSSDVDVALVRTPSATILSIIDSFLSRYIPHFLYFILFLIFDGFQDLTRSF